MFKKALCILGITLLAGCEVPVMIAAAQNQGEMTGMMEITFPASMIVQFDDGTEEVLNGQLIGHANGSAKFNVVGPNWGTCAGSVTRDGVSTMLCDGGVNITTNVGKQRPKMSGVNVATGVALGTKYKSGFGWGNDGNEASVRAAIDAI